MLTKSNFAIICIFGMFAGFLFSRAALSISMFLFGISAIWGVSPREWFRNKWWLVGAGWVAIFALTYFWSDNKGTWYVHWQQKFPVLLLPLAFAYMPRFSHKQIQNMTICMAIMLLISVGYSMFFLVTDLQKYIREYNYSVILPTLPKSDHIRASIAATLFIVWSVYAWPMLTGRIAKWFIGIAVGIFVIYIHILAVKSGLLSFYLFLIGWGLYLSFAKKKFVGIIVIIAIPLFIAFGIKYMPTFRERANYIGFTYFMFTHGDISGNYGDINRLFSYKVAITLIEKHPLAGVGVGDMLGEMGKGYHKLYPEVPDSKILLPHNQFLVVALGCGIPAMLLFIMWVFMPLEGLRKNRQSFFFFMVWLILFLQLMIEPVLEVQMGVFVYLFFLLLQKHELKYANIKTPAQISVKE